ncbi:MAG: 4-oxalocrotonate tautomerase family protein [Erysipelotrichaceae bacterium]|nr:4-oxalocrotonate tautomerase family protein [Erysipelotrichaceae bacterium]
MPYMNITTIKTLTLYQEKKLKTTIDELITILPGKKPENLMIHIEDNQVIYFRDNDLDCMKITIQVFHSIDYEYKREFVQKLTKAVEHITKIPVSQQYATIEEHEHWGKNGDFE